MADEIKVIQHQNIVSSDVGCMTIAYTVTIEWYIALRKTHGVPLTPPKTGGEDGDPDNMRLV